MPGETNILISDENLKMEYNHFRSEQFHQGPGCDDDSESLGRGAENVPEGAEKDCGHER